MRWLLGTVVLMSPLAMAQDAGTEADAPAPAPAEASAEAVSEEDDAPAADTEAAPAEEAAQEAPKEEAAQEASPEAPAEPAEEEAIEQAPPAKEIAMAAEPPVTDVGAPAPDPLGTYRVVDAWTVRVVGPDGEAQQFQGAVRRIWTAWTDNTLSEDLETFVYALPQRHEATPALGQWLENGEGEPAEGLAWLTSSDAFASFVTRGYPAGEGEVGAQVLCPVSGPAQVCYRWTAANGDTWIRTTAGFPESGARITTATIDGYAVELKREWTVWPQEDAI